MKGRDFYHNPSNNEMELVSNPSPHVSSSEKNLRTINELKDLKKYQDSTNIHHPSYGTHQEPTVGTTLHRQKYPDRYKKGYIPWYERDKKEKINKEPLVKQFRNDDPTTYLTDENQQKGMLLATIEDAKPKPKKINKYAEVKIAIPVIDHSLLRNPKEDARKAAQEKLREYAFRKAPDPDAVKGIGSFRNTIGRKLRAATSRNDWAKNNLRTYKDNHDE